MIFAELIYDDEYAAVHDPLVSLLRKHFSQVESGLQGDSWIWILDESEKVTVDTFTSMKHQVKSAKPGLHVQKVIQALQTVHKLRIYQKPELEAHEPEGLT